jgi:hypothetical protein
MSIALGLAALGAACSEAPAAFGVPLEPQVSISRSERTFRMFRTACNGELVTLAGMTDITTVEQNGLLSVRMVSEGLGVGQTSAYSISWTQAEQLVEGQVTRAASTELLRLRGNGATPDTFIRGFSTVTLLPDGSVAVELDFNNEACHGN